MCVRACVCLHACIHTHTNPLYGRMHTNIPTHTHTGQRKSNFKINPFGEKEWEKRMRAPKPPPVLADCKGLSVTAAFYSAKGKQQDSTRGPIKDYSSWKSALAHGLEYTRALIFWAVGAHSIFTGCATPAGTAAHADAITHTVRLMLRLTHG